MKTAKVLLILIAVTCFAFILYMSILALSDIRPIVPLSVTANSSLPVPTPQMPSGPMDPLAVSENELVKLPGIGPATAQNYMDYLQQGGGFFFPEDLKNVKGIGDKKAIDLLPYFHFTLPTLPPPSPLFP